MEAQQGIRDVESRGGRLGVGDIRDERRPEPGSVGGRDLPLEWCAESGLIDRRIVRKLVAYGFATLGDLTDAPRGELERIPHLGASSQEKIIDVLNRFGLRMADQSPAAAALSEQKRRLRMAGVRFAIVCGRTEDGRQIEDMVLVDQGNGRFRSPGAEETREWCRRYPSRAKAVGLRAIAEDGFDPDSQATRAV